MTDLAASLDSTSAFVSRFVVFPDDRYADVVALWVAHTWAIGAATSTPYLWVTSPQMRSGKTRLLEVLELLAKNAWQVVEPSEAVAFRKIAIARPTLLLDEVDVIFAHERKGDSQAGLKAIINAGYRCGASVPRAEQGGANLVDYPVFCAKALAGIGKNLPPTVVDRSIKVPLQRRLPSERVERFKRRDAEAEAQAVTSAMDAAVRDRWDDLDGWREHLPEDQLLASDRQAEIWEPLFAIAEVAGGHWSTHARDLAEWTCKLSDAEPDVATLLLQHIREAFGDDETIRSCDLIASLTARDDGPWAAWWKDQEQGDLMDLARRLREYGAAPRNVRTPVGVARGYHRRDFADAFARYLGDEEEVTVDV